MRKNRNNQDVPLMDAQARRRMQHEIKLYMEKYLKEKLGRGVDHTKINICEDMLIVRGEGFLTEPEKFILTTADTKAGAEGVNAARTQVAKQHAIDNVPYFEQLLRAKATHSVYKVVAEQDFWIHITIFDRVLVENDA